MFLQKGVVVTGGASGIGRALCTTFAKKYARVLALDCDPSGLASLVEEHSRFGFSTRSALVDITDTKAVVEVIKNFEFDTWINNAGVHGNGEFLSTTDELWDQVMRVNLFALVAGSRIALSRFAERGTGILVNIASLAGVLPAPFMSLYSASKHAVVGFTRSLQAELRMNRSNVRAILVNPGFVRTPLITKDPHHTFPRWLEGLLASPEQVAVSVVRAIEKGEEEIVPAMGARIMKRLLTLSPGAVVPMTRLLLSESPTDFFLRRIKSPLTTFKPSGSR